MPVGEFERTAIGLGMLLPAVITAAGLLLARRLSRVHGALDSLAATVALTIAFGASCFAVPVVRWNWEPWELPRGWEWLAYSFFGGGLIIGITGAVPSALVRTAGVIVAAALTADWLVPYWAALGPTRGHWDIGLAIAVLTLYFQLRETAERISAFTVALALFLTTVAASAVLMLAGIASFAQTAGILTACIAVCVIASWRDRNAKYLAAALPILALPLTGLLVSGYLNSYSKVPRWSYVFVWLAPFMLRLVADARRPSRGQVALPFAAMIALLGVAVALAVRAAPPFEP